MDGAAAWGTGSTGGFAGLDEQPFFQVSDKIGIFAENNFGSKGGRFFEVAVIEDPAAAEVSLDPVRARLLAELAEPARPRRWPPESAWRGRR